MNKIFIFLTFLLLNCSSLYAQFLFDGEYRMRYEFRNGYNRLPDNNSVAANFVSQRSRLRLNYKNNRYSTRLTLQDVRVWGDEKLKSDNPSLGIYEAWVDFKLTDSINLRLGRQELIYDNERLLSNNNWRQTGQVHDAALLKIIYNGYEAHLGGAFNQSTENVFSRDYSSIPENYNALAFLWLSKKFNNIKISIISLNDGYQKLNTVNTIYFRNTVGYNIEYTIKNISLIGRMYYQTGKNSYGKKIDAYYFSPEILFKANKFTINPGMEYLSGTDLSDINNKKDNAFSTLYGTGHTYFGHMDYFNDIPKHTKNAGLVDLFLRNNFKMSEKSLLIVDYHYFTTEQKYFDAAQTKKYNKYLGNEVDFAYKHNFSNDISIHLGYSIMFGTETNAKLLGGDKNKLGHWAFLMLTVKPSFIK